MYNEIKTDSGINFVRIDNDTNGNPRYVCHYLNLVTEKDRTDIKNTKYPCTVSFSSKELSGITHKAYKKYVRFDAENSTDYLYKIALWRAHKIGGKKYHNKKYGGGIVFQSYNIEDTAKSIKEISNN